MKSEDTSSPLRKKRKVLIAGLIIAVIGLTLTGLVLGGAISINLSCLGVSGTQRTFTLIANSNGYNDSKTLVGLGVWPIMNVSRCDNVTIKVVNTDTQAHGVAVGVLAMPGIEIPAGQTLSLNFLAYKTGQFRVYCTIICTVHDYMQNGQLNVT